MRKTMCALAGALLAVAPAEAAVTISGPSTSSGFAAAGEAGGARLRAFLTSASQQELFLGKSDLGVGTNRVGQHVTWASSNHFTLSYDAAADVLSAVINNGPALIYANFLANLSPAVAARPFDLLSVGVRDGALGGLIRLSELTLNGEAIGADINGFDGGGFRFWSIRGADFKQSFTFAGTLSLDGQFAASPVEGSKVEFIIGTAAIPEPATWALMIGGFGLVGAALRRRRRVAVAA